MLRKFLLAIVLAATGLVSTQVAAQAEDVANVMLPVHVNGSLVSMSVQYFKPPGDGPFPVVIHLHGRATNRAERAAMRHAVPPSHVRWWLAQGVAVVAPIRVGYGVTGGPDIEDTGARWRAGTCTGEPQFARVAWAARDSAAIAHKWVMEQPWARKDRIVVEGYSLGGLAAVAVGGLGLPGVKGVINFSGGTAANPIDAPGRSCRPEVMSDAYRVLGQQSRVPGLWLYAENDSYWGREAPRAWHEAFRAGGGDADLLVTGPVEGGEGHWLMMRGSQLWAGRVGSFVRRVGLVAD